MFVRKPITINGLCAVLDAGEVARVGELACIDTATGQFKAGIAGLASLQPFGTFTEALVGDGARKTYVAAFSEITAFAWLNDTIAPVTMPADRGALVYIKDARTVTADSGGGANAVAGVAIDIDVGGRVLVQSPIGFASSGSGSGAAAGETLVFSDYGAQDPAQGRYTSWADLYAAALAGSGPIRIAFDQFDINIPIVIPGAAWVFPVERRMTWESLWGLGRPTTVVLDDGCVIHDLNVVGVGLYLLGDSSSPSLAFSPTGGANVLLVQGPGSAIANLGTSPMIEWSVDNSVQLLIIALQQGAISSLGAGAPVLHVKPTDGDTAFVALFAFDGSLVEPDTISDDDRRGTAMCPITMNGEAFVAFDQPQWTGAVQFGINPLTKFPVSYSRPRFNIQSNVLAPGRGPYVMGNQIGVFDPYLTGENGSEFVRFDGSVPGFVDVTLPDPRYCHGQTCLFKETQGTSGLGQLRLTTPFGAVEYFSPTKTFPAVGHLAVRVTSDGENWWIT
jgi:hypothetical protein